MWLDMHHTRGIGELLTIEAMSELKKLGGKRISLGIVAMMDLGFTNNTFVEADKQPTFFSMLLKPLVRISKFFYNSNGIALFRKRFNISHWEPVFVSVKINGAPLSASFEWLKVFTSLTAEFKPRIYFSNIRQLGRSFITKFTEHPVSFSFGAIALTIFMAFNHTDVLPEKVLRQFSFDLQAPWYEWFYRSFTSDFLFFDRTHFLFCFPLYFALLYIMENKQKLKFVFYFVLLSHFLDDFINYFFIIKPFHFLQSTLYLNLVTSKDVGCSLGMVTVLGFLINTEMRRTRELILIAIAIGLVFGFAFVSLHFSSFILNLNHFLFFLIGYGVGKIKFEMMRAENRRNAKNKSPYQKQPQD